MVEVETLRAQLATRTSASPLPLDALHWLDACAPVAESPDIPTALKARWLHERSKQWLMSGRTESRPMAEQALAVTTGQFMPVPAGMRVPGWVRRACRRGLAVEPTQRWDSMAELLAALRRDPAPRRRRLAAAAGVLLAIGGVWGGAEVRAARREAACTAAAGALGASWNPALRGQVEAAMLASGAEHAAASVARARRCPSSTMPRRSSARRTTCASSKRSSANAALRSQRWDAGRTPTTRAAASSPTPGSSNARLC